MAVPRNRGLWANGQPIAPGSRIPVSKEALAGEQAGADVKSIGDIISARVHELFGPKKDRPRLPLKGQGENG